MTLGKCGDAACLRRIEKHTPYQAVARLVIILPVRANGELASNVPHVQFVILVLERLDVESKRGRDGGNVFAIELLHDCGLARIVEATVMNGGWWTITE